MSYDDVVKAERLILPASLPMAWNIGPALPTEEEEHLAALAREAQRVTAHVFGPGSMEVRFHTGRTDPAVMLFDGGTFRAVLWPDQVAAIVAHWKRCGVELEKPFLARWPLYELAQKLAKRLAAGMEENPDLDDAQAGVSRIEVLDEAAKMGLLR